MPVSSSPVPSGEKGHYSFIFPVRPGETRFQVSYRLPYNGTLIFQPRMALPTLNYAVVLPKSMSFKAGADSAFAPMNGDAGSQSFLAKNVLPMQTLSFTVAGNGTLSRGNSSEQKKSGDQGTRPTPDTQDNRPSGGMAPIDTPDPLNQYKWWIISGIALVLAIGASYFLRSNSAVGLAAAYEQPIPVSSGQNLWLATLKEQLFALEAERIGGHIPDAEYGEQKAALEILLKRTLTSLPRRQ
jgi:hypothetical protein